MKGKTINRAESEYDNSECEYDHLESSSPLSIPLPFPRILEDVYSNYKKKKIFLQPDFQRDFIWTKAKQAELIKSLWRNIPLPTFYFAVAHNSKLEVIDGQQRLTTIFGYIDASKIDEKMRTRLVKNVKIKNGKNEFVTKQQIIKKIKSSSISCVYIEEKGLNINDKFEIFRSLNQGATPLKIQEIRNAIYQKENKYLNNSLKISAKRLETLLGMKNTRMLFEDLVLRFFIINERGYEKTVSRQLNNHKDVIDSFTKDKVDKSNTEFKYFFSRMDEWFGGKVFQTLALNSKNKNIDNKEWSKFIFSNKINQGLFHLFSYYIPLYARHKISINKIIIRKKYIALLKTKKFVDLISGSGTDSTAKIKKSKIMFEKLFLKPCFGDWSTIEKRNVTVSFKKTLLENVPFCYLCYGSLKKIEYLATLKSAHGEHIKSFKSQRKTSEDNILLAHAICNHNKSSSTLEEFRSTKKSIAKRKKHKNKIDEYLIALKDWNRIYPLEDFRSLVAYAKKDKNL